MSGDTVNTFAADSPAGEANTGDERDVQLRRTACMT